MDIDKIIDKQVALVNQALQIGVEAGQQSRQAEVDSLEKGWVERKNERDELQKRIDELKAQLILQGQRFNDQSQKVSDLEFDNKLMQKRIDKVIREVNEYYDSDGMSDLVFFDVVDILKGKEND